MDWETMFKRYVWDTERTPYFTPVSRLTRVQADFEVLAFSIFMGVLFSVVALGALTDKSMFGRSPPLGLYAFSVTASAIVFNYTKLLIPAIYLAASPLACLAYVIIYGFDGARLRVDSLIAGGIVLMLTLYAPRIIGIARAYESMPAGVAPPPRRTLFK